MPLIKNLDEYNIVAIDPGLTTTGVAIFTINNIADTIKNVTAFTLNSDKLPNSMDLSPEIYTERVIKLHKIKSAIVKILYDYKPIGVACENSFYNRFRPMAYGSLLEVINTIQAAVIEYNTNVVMRLIEPLLVKKMVDAQPKGGKEAVLEGVRKVPLIMNNLDVNIDLLDEHSIDALAIGYSYLILNELTVKP